MLFCAICLGGFQSLVYSNLSPSNFLVVRWKFSYSWLQYSLRFFRGYKFIPQGVQRLVGKTMDVPLFSEFYQARWLICLRSPSSWACAALLRLCSVLFLIPCRPLTITCQGIVLIQHSLISNKLIFLLLSFLFSCQVGEVKIKLIVKIKVGISLQILVNYSPCHVVTLQSAICSTSWMRRIRCQ